MPDNPAKPPRFPYVGALLCAACVGTAGYLWMRYSYVWKASVTYIHKRTREIDEGQWPAFAYVEFPAVWRGPTSDMERQLIDGGPLKVYDTNEAATGSFLWLYANREPGVGVTSKVRGRVAGAIYCEQGPYHKHPFPMSLAPGVVSGLTRFHGASIAGLVVGAMGVFVFTVALRHWLRERRKFREEAEGA